MILKRAMDMGHGTKDCAPAVITSVQTCKYHQWLYFRRFPSRPPILNQVQFRNTSINVISAIIGDDAKLGFRNWYQEREKNSAGDEKATRNYKNCIQCKKARKKCTPATDDKGPWVGFPASLSAILPALGSTLPPTDGSRASSEEGDEVHRGTKDWDAHDRDHFGDVYYILPCDDGQFVDVIHIKTTHKDNQEQMFKTRCDKEYQPVGPGIYLGPKEIFLPKFQAAMQSLTTV
ncbi:hypothetical protein PNOK_0011500 [Pyrrhoderma noxium]|uniref:Uncharacterized protein n=1 Tax=Pyrrhoderma noxium TaxID=2282107 RepID=A0A286UTZ9_9AGAM|nr:hypothetical protein PNOK_0011500 [Pyrrhoderma noxium]